MLLVSGFLNFALSPAQSAPEEEQRAMDERALIKTKIKELEKAFQEKQSPELEKQLGVLKRLEETVDIEDRKAQEQRIREQELQLSQEAFEAQQERIKQAEETIDASLIAPDGSAGTGEDLYKSRLSPEEKKAIEKKIEQEAAYFTCRAALEGGIGPCDKIRIQQFAQKCCNMFKGTYMVNQIIKNKGLTPGALETCRELKDSFTGEDCRLIGQACLTGDVSEIASLPSFERAAGRLKLALISGEEKYCLGLMGDELESCLDAAAYTFAIKSGGLQACAKIKGAPLKALCQVYFNKDSSICDRLLE